MNKKLQVTTYGHNHTIQKLHETNSIANAKLFRYVLLDSYEKALFLKEVYTQRIILKHHIRFKSSKNFL